MMQKRNRRHGFSCLFFTVGLLLTLAASTSSAAVKLNIYVPGGGQGIYGVFAKRAADVAKSLGYDATIVTGDTWDDFYQKVAVHVAGDVSVDLVLVYLNFRLDGATVASLLDLAPYVRRDRIDMSRLAPPLVQMSRIGSMQLGIPVRVGATALYYNAELFAATGVPEPPKNWDDRGWTWDEFVATAKKFTNDTDGNGILDQFGLSRWFPEWNPWFWGTNWTDPTASYSLINQPDLLAAVSQGFALFQATPVVPNSLIKFEGSTSWSSFYNGKSAMHPAGSESYWGPKQNAKFKFDVGIFPSVKTRKSQVEGFMWSIGRSSKHPNEAWEVIKRLAFDESAVMETVKAGGGDPALLSVYKRLTDYYAALQKEVSWSVFLEVIQTPSLYGVRPWMWNKNAQELQRLFSNTWAEIYAGKKPLIPALQELHPRWDALLREGRYEGVYLP